MLGNLSNLEGVIANSLEFDRAALCHLSYAAEQPSGGRRDYRFVLDSSMSVSSPAVIVCLFEP